MEQKTNIFRWGMAGPSEKVTLFLSDLSYADCRHQLEGVVLTDKKEASIAGQVTVYSGLPELLQSGIDAVYLATPYEGHFREVQQCLLQRKAVLCERPISANRRELDTLIRLSEDCGAFMMEAAWVRFVPSVRKLLGILDNGTLGAVVSLRISVYRKSLGEGGNPLRHESGGGVLDELGAYPAFLCTLLLGLPAYVQASVRGKEAFTSFLSYDEGQYAFVEASAAVPGESEALITCERGSIRIRNPWSVKPEGIEVAYHDGTKVLHRSRWEGYGLYFELDEVCESVTSGQVESALYTHDFMRDVRTTMDLIREKLS